MVELTKYEGKIVYVNYRKNEAEGGATRGFVFNNELYDMDSCDMIKDIYGNDEGFMMTDCFKYDVKKIREIPKEDMKGLEGNVYHLMQK